ncbi:MAG: hypothetical protein MR850_07685 [Bacteroidales bacterium]|nr:hypothetical protein [Bacteroidales bacterium]
MDIRKGKVDLFKTIYMAFKPRLKDILSEEQMMILHLHLIEDKCMTDIADHLQLADVDAVREELKKIKLRIAALG